jgi:hypothetical protein
MREWIVIPELVTNPFHFHTSNECMLDFGTQNMPFARWKFDALIAFSWIPKYPVEHYSVFNPHCNSFLYWIATVQQTSIAFKSKLVGCGFSQIAVPAYPIFAWTEAKEYVKYIARGIPKDTPLI